MSTVTPGAFVYPASRVVEVWSPRAIAWLTFFFRVPLGLILVSHNFSRLGMREETRKFFIITVIAASLYLIALTLLPDGIGTYASFVINLVGLFSLRAQAEGAVASLTFGKETVYVATRNAWLGIGLRLVVALCIVVVTCGPSAAFDTLGPL